MGDANVVRALTVAGIPCAIFGPPSDTTGCGRATALPWQDQWDDPEGVVAILLDHAKAVGRRQVLYPQTDADLLVVSRHRARLAEAYAFLLPHPDMIEVLLDKVAFSKVAAGLGVLVPRSTEVDAKRAEPGDVALDFPIVLKPLVRHPLWKTIEPSAKALHVETRAELAGLWPRLAEAGIRVLAQESIPGDETQVESYHAYVDANGRVVAAFTGRKLRTFPTRYGHSSALELSEASDVDEIGREVVARLGLCGVAKVDFKRGPDGRLWLLEVNPRFTLWHHPAAVGGLNIPAIVHADLTGMPRPDVGAARPGVTWCHPRYDIRSARSHGVGMASWLRFVRRCEAVSPGTFFGSVVRRVPALR
jgi:predicted ATP-grasp superfamily ATP-dependent carboligase